MMENEKGPNMSNFNKKIKKYREQETKQNTAANIHF